MGATTTFRSPQEFAREFPKMAGRAVRELGRVAVGEIHARMGKALKGKTPIGGLLSKDRHPGLMRASWRGSAGDGPRRVGVWINTAPHAQIIDEGRRRAQSFTQGKRTQKRRRADFHERGQGIAARGKWLGSLQAPQGVTAPAWKEVQRQMDQVRKVAIDAAERAA